MSWKESDSKIISSSFKLLKNSKCIFSEHNDWHDYSTCKKFSALDRQISKQKPILLEQSDTF